MTMKKLTSSIDAYDTYGDLSVDRYFTVRYGSFASTAEITVPVDPQKESFKLIYDCLGLEKDNYEVVYQEWEIVRHSDVKDGDDYIKYSLLAGAEQAVCIEIQTYVASVSVEFFFAEDRPGLQAWVFQKIHQLRAAFSKPASPVFRVLSQHKGEFRTRKVDIDHSETNLAENYNDSLVEIDEIIQGAIESRQSGLILLHGIPGTGKTTYIKSLLSRNTDEQFIFIPNDFVEEMLKPSFITFLITRKNSILVIEDAESVIMARENKANKSIVSTILQITDGLFSDYLNIKVICTFNTEVSKIDKALFRKGRLIAFYEFKELEEQKAMKLMNASSTSQLPEVRTLANLFNYQDPSFADTQKKRRIGFGN